MVKLEYSYSSSFSLRGEEFKRLPSPPRRRHAFATPTSLSLLSLPSVLAPSLPLFSPQFLPLQLGDKQRKQAAGDVDKAAPQINTPASELQNLPEIEGNLFAGDFGKQIQKGGQIIREGARK